jgi:hypothetical protein
MASGPSTDDQRARNGVRVERTRKRGQVQKCSARQLFPDIPDEWHEVCAMPEAYRDPSGLRVWGKDEWKAFVLGFGGGRKDCHVVIGITSDARGLSGPLGGRRKKVSEVAGPTRARDFSCRGCDHRLAILVHEEGDLKLPYPALVIRQSAMLFSRRRAPWGRRRCRLARRSQLV